MKIDIRSSASSLTWGVSVAFDRAHVQAGLPRNLDEAIDALFARACQSHRAAHDVK